jgi:hypothetical protein
MPLDIYESSLQRGVADAVGWLGSLWGIAVLAIAGFVGTWWASGRTDDGVLVAGAAVIFVLVFAAGVVFACVAFIAPREQREAARERLAEIHRKAHTFGIVGIEARRDVSASSHAFLVVDIENTGRAASFAASLVGAESADTRPIGYIPLEWRGSPAMVVEEIPTGERRTIGVGRYHGQGGEHPRVVLWPAMPGGGVMDLGFFMDEPPRLTLWLQVSARAVGEVGYSRRIGVVLEFHPESEACSVALLDPVDGDEKFAPSFSDLLNYEVRDS